ncbi:ROK family transcriptional regulator [Schaalia sp. ZJ405]|uniref:ROK family transcriptional regulator n=1 Tax=Schaalia sp. ZJ405 TaxID=2709403 RepID=UPI0013EBB505|nr:ROK family transcriptional regulator [Schaalia sp. ZJ405]QPK80664.1 ROK family transcriptional regulator [Schaalia sp. ZJ405]
MGVSELSRHNSLRILRFLFAQGPASRISLGKELKLAPATVNRLCARLLQEGLLVDRGINENTGGRPSMVVDFNAARGCLLVADIADHRTVIRLIDLRGAMLREWIHPTEGDASVRYHQFFEHIEHAWNEAADHQVIAIGVSVPGPVNDDGIVLFAPAFNWKMVPLKADLESRFTVPIAVENDANLIAIAQARDSHWDSYRSLFVLAVFDGIGSGIIENRSIWRGAVGAAGQVGRLLMGSSSLVNDYSGYGDLESHLGASSMVRRALDAGLNVAEVPDADAIFRLAQNVDSRAVELVDGFLDDFALALVNVCALLAPEVILFAGLFDRWSEYVLPRLQSRLEDHVVHVPLLAPVHGGDTAALLGARWIAFDAAGGIEALLHHHDV